MVGQQSVVILAVFIEVSLGKTLLLVESRHTVQSLSAFLYSSNHVCKFHYCFFVSPYVVENVLSFQCVLLVVLHHSRIPHYLLSKMDGDSLYNPVSNFFRLTSTGLIDHFYYNEDHLFIQRNEIFCVCKVTFQFYIMRFLQIRL